MSESVFATAFNSLSEPQRAETDNWFLIVSRYDSTGDIYTNIQTEKQIELSIFLEFWNLLMTNCKNPILEIKTIYENLCKQYNFNGTISRLHPDTIIFSITNEKDLREIIKDALGYVDSENAWIEFWANSLEEQDRIDILYTAGFHYRKEIVWAYFDEISGETVSFIDPLQNTNADDHCKMLGLPVEWNKYAFGEHLWKIKLKPSVTVNKHIPTIFDAGWNRWFQTITESPKSAKWGWKRPLESARGTTGVPEIIFKGWISGKGNGTFVAIPEDIGLR